MIGHGQYGELQFGGRSLTQVSSGIKSSESYSPTTSTLQSTSTETVTPTDLSLSVNATEDVGDAIDLASSVDSTLSITQALDTSSSTDLATLIGLSYTSQEAVDVPLEVDGLFTSYSYDPFKSSEVATSIQKAIGSEQYGDFQWGNISTGLPVDRVIPTEYSFLANDSTDIGNSVIRSPDQEFYFSPQKTIDAGSATEKPTSVPLTYGIQIGLGLVVDVVNAQKPDLSLESLISKIESSTTLNVDSTGYEYGLFSASDTSNGIEDVDVISMLFSPTTLSEVGNTTIDSTNINYSYGVTISDALSVSTDLATIVSITLSPETASIVSSGLDSAGLAEYNLNIEDSTEFVTVILSTSNPSFNFDTVQSSIIGNTTDIATVSQYILSTISTSEYSSSTDISTATGLQLVPVTTEEIALILDNSSKINYELLSEQADVISSSTDISDNVGIVYDPILSISEGFFIETIIITHDYNSKIIHEN